MPMKCVVAVERLQALLEDAVAAVVGDHEGDRQLLVGRRPQRLDRVHGAAVAEQQHTGAAPGPARTPTAAGDAPADAAADIAEEAVAVAEGERSVRWRPAGQALVDDDGIRAAARWRAAASASRRRSACRWRRVERGLRARRAWPSSCARASCGERRLAPARRAPSPPSFFSSGISASSVSFTSARTAISAGKFLPISQSRRPICTTGSRLGQRLDLAPHRHAHDRRRADQQVVTWRARRAPASGRAISAPR